MKLLLDTNILIDYFGKREPWFSDTQKMFAAGAFADINLWCSAKSFTDIVYSLRKAVKQSELRLKFMEVLGYLNVCSLTHNDILSASEHDHSDFEDAVILECFENVNANYLVTRDLALLRYCSEHNIRTISPTEVLAKLSAKGFNYDEIVLSAEEYGV